MAALGPTWPTWDWLTAHLMGLDPEFEKHWYTGFSICAVIVPHTTVPINSPCSMTKNAPCKESLGGRTRSWRTGLSITMSQDDYSMCLWIPEEQWWGRSTLSLLLVKLAETGGGPVWETVCWTSWASGLFLFCSNDVILCNILGGSQIYFILFLHAKSQCDRAWHRWLLLRWGVEDSFLVC